MIGFLFSVCLGLILVPILKKLHVGQTISVYVGESHRKKAGTPTMGGIIFILPTVLIMLALLFLGKVSYTDNLAIVLLVFCGFAIIGILDEMALWSIYSFNLNWF